MGTRISQSQPAPVPEWYPYLLSMWVTPTCAIAYLEMLELGKGNMMEELDQVLTRDILLV